LDFGFGVLGLVVWVLRFDAWVLRLELVFLGLRPWAGAYAPCCSAQAALQVTRRPAAAAAAADADSNPHASAAA